MIRTVVAATAAIARAGLSALLRGDARVAVIGETTAAGLPELIAALAPDVVLEQRDEPGDALYARALDGEGHGVLARDADSETIVAAVIAVAAGLVVAQPHAVPASDRAAYADGAERLSTREIDVLGRLAEGDGNKAIASALEISEHTVKFHIASIFAKLGVSSRTEAVTAGVRRGLIML
jgi:DNA-binding NarL/FixJ family response regulator